MEKTIETLTIEQTKSLIESAHAVVCNDSDAGLCYPSVWELTGNTNNDWLFCEYTTDKGHTISHIFSEAPQEVIFDGTSIYMKDNTGEVIDLILLVPMTKHLNTKH